MFNTFGQRVSTPYKLIGLLTKPSENGFGKGGHAAIFNRISDGAIIGFGTPPIETELIEIIRGHVFRHRSDVD